MRRVALLLLAFLLPLTLSAPARADPDTDTLMLFNMMLAPLVMDNNVRHPQVPAAPVVAPRSPDSSVDTSQAPACNGANAPLGNDLTAGGLPVDHHSPEVRAFLDNLAVFLAGLIGLFGVAIVIVCARHTVHLHRLIADDRSGKRRVSIR